MQLEELIQSRQDNRRNDPQNPRAKRVDRHVFIGVRDTGLHVGIYLFLAAGAALLTRVDSSFMRVLCWIGEFEAFGLVPVLLLLLGFEWSLHDCNVRVVVGFWR